MQLIPQSYADFKAAAALLDSAVKVGYLTLPASGSYFVYAYLPTVNLLMQFSEGGLAPEAMPNIAADFPGALVFHSTINFITDRFLSFNNLEDYATFIGAMPAPLTKILFGSDGTTVEAYAVVGSGLVIELTQDITPEAFLASFPTATQLAARIECSADFSPG